MHLRTPAQSNRLFGLLGKLDIDNEGRAYLVEQFTEGRTTSTKELREHECAALIDHLDNLVRNTNADAAQKMRRKVFSIAHELGWEDIGGKVDTDRLHNWLLKYGYLHKPLNDYTSHELPRLITQLEKVLHG